MFGKDFAYLPDGSIHQLHIILISARIKQYTTKAEAVVGIITSSSAEVLYHHPHPVQFIT